MIKQDIKGIKAIIKDSGQAGSYWLIDLAHGHTMALQAQEIAPKIATSRDLLFVCDGKAFFRELAIVPSADMNIACLKTIKALISKKSSSSIDIPALCDATEARDWIMRAVQHALAKISDLGLGALVALECQTILATVAMEQQGVPFHKFRWQNTLNDLEKESHFLKKELQDKLNHDDGFELFGSAPLDLHNPAMVKTALERVLGQKLAGTSQESLAHIKHEAVELLLRLREQERLLSTYGTNFLSKVHNNRLHGIFEPLGTTSGRFSCHSPNLQALPSHPLFQACIDPGPTKTLLSFDYGGFELRILAALSADEALLDVFNRDLDIHSMVATAVFKVDVSKTTHGHLREQAKVLNFGIIYGMGEQALARKLNMSLSGARELLTTYFARFSQVHAFLLELERSAKTNGYCRTALGRRAYFSGDINTDLRHKMRVARNMPIQGTGADIVKLAMCTVFKQLQKRSLDARLINSIHDELVVECRQEHAGDVSVLVSRCMEKAFSAVLPNVLPQVMAKPYLAR